MVSPSKNTPFVILLTLASSLAILLYVVIYEKETTKNAKSDTQRYSEFIASHLWDLNNESAQEYTELIAKDGQFSSVSVTHPDQSTFAFYSHTPEHNGIHSFFRSVGLIKDIQCNNSVTYKGKEIGRISTVRENTNVYIYLTLTLLAILSIVILSLIRAAKLRKIVYSKVEHDLSENKERLQNVVSASPVISFSLDQYGQFTVCEGMGLNKLHNKDFNIIGKTIQEVESHMPINSNDFHRALKGNTFSEIRDCDGRSFETWYSPLLDHSDTIGVMAVATDVTAAIQAMESLRSFKRIQSKEHRLAQRAHQTVLSTSTPSVDGYEIGLLLKPTETIGGDYLHMSKSPEQTDLSITFAEVSGHGTTSVLLTTILQSLLKTTLGKKDQSLVKSFYKLNSRIHELFPEGSFASTFHTIINSANATMRYVKASREPAVLFSKNSKPRIIDKGGPALGLLPSDLLNSASYEEHSIQLKAGDTLFLYSNGLIGVECPDGEILDRKQIITAVYDKLNLPPQEIVESIYQLATSHAAAEMINDDISLLVIRKL